MKEISKQLTHLVTDSYEKMDKISKENWNKKIPGKWSKKEILGHLIDSASNNHQRFVRAQYEDKTPISYDGDTWVKIQQYTSSDIKTLLGLWLNYNLHLGHVISEIPVDKYKILFKADAKEAATLEWIVKDYVRHMEHHLKQILN